MKPFIEQKIIMKKIIIKIFCDRQCIEEEQAITAWKFKKMTYIFSLYSNKNQ